MTHHVVLRHNLGPPLLAVRLALRFRLRLAGGKVLVLLVVVHRPRRRQACSQGEWVGDRWQRGGCDTPVLCCALL